MPANNLTELYNFEGNIEAAFQTWFSDQSLTLEVGIGTDTLPDNCISFQFLLGAATGHYALSAVNSKAEYDQFQFTIDVIIQTQRQTTEASQTAQVGTRHQELVALSRVWMSRAKNNGSLLETYLNYYAFNTLIPAGTSFAQDEDFDETTLSFSGQVSILANAWPA